MNLTHDAMLVSLRISAWSGRQYDRKASNHVAVHHEASASAGRYNKCLLPKAAFAALTATMSKARSSHYEQTLPWDDQGSRLLTVANYEHYMALLDGLGERMVRERARFIEDYEDNIDQARLDLGKLFRIEDYPSKEALQGKFGIRYRITPVPDADHFMANLASDDTDRVKRDIEHQVEERLHDAVGDLYRRLCEAVERVSERLNKGRILEIARSVLSPAWASARSKNKKPDLAKAMEQAFAAGDPPLGLSAEMHAAALAWVPPGFAAFDTGRVDDEAADAVTAAPEQAADATGQEPVAEAHLVTVVPDMEEDGHAADDVQSPSGLADRCCRAGPVQDAVCTHEPVAPGVGKFGVTHQDPFLLPEGQAQRRPAGDVALRVIRHGHGASPSHGQG